MPLQAQTSGSDIVHPLLWLEGVAQGEIAGKGWQNSPLLMWKHRVLRLFCLLHAVWLPAVMHSCLQLEHHSFSDLQRYVLVHIKLW